MEEKKHLRRTHNQDELWKIDLEINMHELVDFS